MKAIFSASLALGLVLAPVTAADARDGCGPGGHRDYYGHCRPNGRGPVFVGPGLVIGSFYPGRGYWDGRRYWGRRDHWHGGWRYR